MTFLNHNLVPDSSLSSRILARWSSWAPLLGRRLKLALLRLRRSLEPGMVRLFVLSRRRSGSSSEGSLADDCLAANKALASLLLFLIP